MALHARTNNFSACARHTRTAGKHRKAEWRVSLRSVARQQTTPKSKMEFVGAGLPQSATDTVLITFNYSAAMFFLHHALNPPPPLSLSPSLTVF